MNIHINNCSIYCNKKRTPNRYSMQVYLGEAVTNTEEAWKAIMQIIQNQK